MTPWPSTPTGTGTDMQLFQVTNIVWDVDDEGDNEEAAEAIGLPDSALVYAEDRDSIADVLSDRFGWCIVSLGAEEVNNPLVIAD